MLQLLNELSAHANPWRNFEHELRRLIPTAFSTYTNHNHSPVNIYGSENGLKVTLRKPGWNAEWFDLSVEENRLLVGGSVPDESKDEQGVRRQSFKRVIHLPYRVEVDKVQAAYKNGILTINLERRQEDQPKKIAIQSA